MFLLAGLDGGMLMRDRCVNDWMIRRSSIRIA